MLLLLVTTIITCCYYLLLFVNSLTPLGRLVCFQSETRDAFAKYDTDGSGEMDVTEVYAMMESLDVFKVRPAPPLYHLEV